MARKKRTGELQSLGFCQKKKVIIGNIYLFFCFLHPHVLHILNEIILPFLSKEVNIEWKC